MAAHRGESAPDRSGQISLDAKQAGKRSAGIPHAGFDEAGDHGSRTAGQRESGWSYHRTLPSARQSSTLLLNLLQLGDGAVMRCQRFRYQWLWQAGVVANTGRNTILLKLPAGEHLQRFGVALRRLATL